MWRASTRPAEKNIHNGASLSSIFALHAPFHHLWLADFGLVEKGVLCAIMTITAGVDLLVPYEVSLGLFLLILYHIASNE